MAAPARREPRFVYLSDADRDQLSAARYGWRLVAANNRPLGRGARIETSLERCRAAAALLHGRLDRVESAVLADAQRGVWTWRVMLGGAPIAVSVHPYLRRVECVRGLTQFVASAAIAEPAEGVARYFGPNSLRGYDADLSTTGVVT